MCQTILRRILEHAPFVYGKESIVDTFVTIVERLGTGVGFGLVCMYFYRNDILSREAQTAALLQECIAVIRNNSSIIAKHTSLLKMYMEVPDDKA